MNRPLIFFLVLLCTNTGVFAQAGSPKTLGKDATAEKYATTILQKDLSKHLHIIAADSMEGRMTGTNGQKKAARYIANHFKSLGLQAPVKQNEGMSYFQEFQQVKRGWGEVYIKLGEEKLNFMKDFFVLQNSLMREETPMSLVWVGKESDLAQVDVSGKGAVFYETENDGAISNLARQKGAKTVLFIKGKDQKEFLEAVSYNAYYLKKPTKGIGGKLKNETAVFFLAPAAAARLLGVSEADLMSQKVPSGTPGKDIRIKAEMIEKVDWTAENVLGFLEGSDKKDEIVVVTAHYDHVGTNDGVVYNGADDDGSGTVTVLEIAEAFAKAKAEGKGPRRSILFMTVSGEELGLYGSEYYTDQDPIFPLKQTVCDLNIDMVGRMGGDYEKSKDPNYIYLIGSDKLSSELHDLSEQVNKNYTKLKLDYKYNSESDPNRFYYRSDHYNFAKNNIPIIFYFNGTHDDYHQPGDDVSKIHFPKMEKIGRLIFHTAWEIANRENRLKVDKSDK
ncbi:MAG: M28 family peptidase [Microscillaceae bacterium]|jgi:hypothetical protein|nr:M28 family peptidase [Microscillaceae bacterium]